MFKTYVTWQSASRGTRMCLLPSIRLLEDRFTRVFAFKSKLSELPVPCLVFPFPVLVLLLFQAEYFLH